MEDAGNSVPCRVLGQSPNVPLYFPGFKRPKTAFPLLEIQQLCRFCILGNPHPKIPKPAEFWRAVVLAFSSAGFWSFPSLSIKLSTEFSTSFGALWIICGHLWINSGQPHFPPVFTGFFLFPQKPSFAIKTEWKYAGLPL